MGWFGRQFLRAVVALSLGLGGTAAWALKCDVDNNGRIDRADISLIQQAVVARAPVSGPDDPRDADSNGVINSIDSRLCVLRCKYPSCATNGAPLADAGPDQTVRVAERVQLNGAASADPDGNALVYSWSFVSRPAGSTAALSNPGAVNPSFVADRPGNYEVQLVVGDGSLNSAPDRVTISTVNSAPVANAGPDQSARVGDVVVLDGRASSDVDGDPLGYAWRIVSAPGGSSAALLDATSVQPRITLDAAGTYVFELIVSDAGSSSAPDTVQVSTVNTAPVARPGANRAVALGALVPLDGSASSDVDGHALTYAWSLLSRPAGSTAVLSNAGVVNPSFSADLPGSYVAQLIVNDGFVDSAPASVTITTENAAPRANAGPDQTVPLGAPVQLDGSASSDPEGTALTYAWSITSRPAGSSATLSAANLVNPGFTADRPGTYVLQLIVNDGVLASAPDSVVISTANSRPLADAGAAQNVATGATVQLDGSASRDADGDALTYAWSLTTRPAGSTAVLGNPGVVNPSFVADQAGSYVAQLIVSDGTLASVPVTVMVTATTPNRPPAAVAAATPGSVNVGQTVNLSSTGSSDPDGTPLSYTWSLALRPAGSVATVNNASAASASFVPDVAGSYTVLLSVSDGSLSAEATASVTANAVAVNRPPTIVTAAPIQATVLAPYTYDVDASDPDAGDTLTYSLTTAPQGMLINGQSGLISWTPSPAQTGAQPVTVRVTDAAGLFAAQSFTINVSATATPLQLAASLTPAIANAAELVTLSTAVSGGNGGAITVSATLNGAPLALNATGSATFAAPAAGTHIVRVTAQAAPVGGSAPAPQVRDLVLTVRNPGDTTAPVAAITSPGADSQVLAPINVTGTASDANLAYYQLLLRPAGAGNAAWVEIYRGLAAVTNATLGTLDPSRVNNGVYELGLNVVDVNGRSTSTLVPIEIARERKLGAFRLSFTDIRADAAGLPLTLTRTYDSLKKDVQGDFGWGWSADATDLSVRKNMILGISWQLQTSGFNQCLRPIGNRRITVTLPDGGVYRFQGRNVPECAFAVPPSVNIVFDPLPLPVGGTVGAAAGGGTLEVTNLPSLVEFRGGMLFDWDELTAWNPKDFIFTSAEGVKFTLREGVGVISMADRYGNTVTYGPGGYQHNAALAVQLVRDAQGRITRATDPAGHSLVYTYNAAGELASVTDRLGQVTAFTYDTATRPPAAGTSGSVNSEHLLSSITDPRGVVVMRAQFDEFGRMAGNTDGNGAATTQTFDEANNLQRVVDRRGNATTYTFDATGNVTRIVDAKGGITDLTYDANGNELTRRDPLGNTVTKTYDAVTGVLRTEADALGRTSTTAYPTTGRDFERQNPVSFTDALGRVTSLSYRAGDTVNPGAMPNTITEPLGRVTTVGQDSRGHLTSISFAGIATSYGYDAAGRRTRETDALGNVTSYTFDGNGNELTRAITRTVGGAPRTETATRTYDAQGRVLQETDAAGAVRRFTYDASGQLATSTDALGRVTTYAYDANSRLVRTEYPDGTRELAAWDANGNQTSSTDRQGRVMRMAYDELNRHVETEHPDGSRMRKEYDAVGRLTSEVDATGGRVVHGYDAVGQLTSTTDANGRRTEYVYDLAGNRTETRTPDGRVTRFTYDALNRLTRIDHPDGSVRTNTYRVDSRKSADTDPRGVTSSYGYDGAGRLTSVQQSGIAAPTTYTFDEAGWRTSQVDALGRVMRWTYDPTGRPLSRTLPDGSNESFVYDADGQPVSAQTFAGQTLAMTRDAAGRVVSRTIPASAGVPARNLAWTYFPDGQKATQTESGATSAQGVTSYLYDANGRLAELSGPQGTLRWRYDAAGRIVERSTDEGATLYEYDASGRVSRVVAPDGRAMTLLRDNAGRVLRTEQVLDAAAGITMVTERRYDAEDRIVALAHLRRDSTGSALMMGEAVTRGAGGAVLRSDTFDTLASFNASTGTFTGTPARIVRFGYDANARLIEERLYEGAELIAFLGNATAAPTRLDSFTYNAVGNRTARSVSTSAGTESTTYAFDGNDRLVSEVLTTATGSTVPTAYTWDGNGNLATRARVGDFTGYLYDAENRLVQVRRGATEATAAVAVSYAYDAEGQRISKTNALGTTRYLIDPTTRWPQVALETRGTERVAYVWGDDGLQQQVRGTAGTLATAPTESLIPLTNHLGSPLGAADAGGVVVERYGHRAFGEPFVAQPRLMHQFGGEYWDPDAELHYLRARWYDARTGRFNSPDPVWGGTTDPRRQNRYAYASGDPVSNADPMGTFTMGSVMSGINIGFTMASLASASYHYLFAAPGDDPPPGDASVIWDALFIPAAVSSAIELADTLAALATGLKNYNHLPGRQAHHVIPQYMCGAAGQKKVLLSTGDHTLLHLQLDTLGRFLAITGDRLAKVIKPRRAGRMSMHDIGKRRMGRIAITSALNGFYTFFDWMPVGIPSPTTWDNIGVGMAMEGPKFIAGTTWCR